MFLCFQQQLKKGVVTLTIRTRLRSPSLTPCPTPILLSRSSSPNSNTSGGTPAPSGYEEADGRRGAVPGPKDCVIMEVTLHKGLLTSWRDCMFCLCFAVAFYRHQTGCELNLCPDSKKEH